MGRIRTIKPEFWTDEELSELPAETHLLAAALLNYADDEGYFNANPKLVKAACSPLREDSVNIHESLQLLSNVGYLKLGTADDGKRYGFIVGFAKHQKVNRPSRSKIKGLEIAWEDSVNTHGALTEDSLAEQGSGNREQGTGNREKTPAPSPEVDDAELDLEEDFSPAKEIVWSLPLNTGVDHLITQGEVDVWAELYPAIDVLAELRKMKGWLIGNPKNRKTRTGINRFITGWLQREQDRAPVDRRRKGRAVAGDPDFDYMNP